MPMICIGLVVSERYKRIKKLFVRIELMIVLFHIIQEMLHKYYTKLSNHSAVSR